MERMEYRANVKKWSIIGRTTSTVAIWSAVAFMCCILRGTLEPPMIAAAGTTALIWLMKD